MAHHLGAPQQGSAPSPSSSGNRAVWVSCQAVLTGNPHSFPLLSLVDLNDFLPAMPRHDNTLPVKGFHNSGSFIRIACLAGCPAKRGSDRVGGP